MVACRDAMKTKVQAAGGPAAFTEDAVNFTPGDTLDVLVAQGEKVGIEAGKGSG